MGISLRPAGAVVVVLSCGWLACSGEDEGKGKGAGTGTTGGNAGAAGGAGLVVGGRAGSESAGQAGAVAGGMAGSGGASPFCLPALAAAPPTSCDGAPPKATLATLTPMPIAVPLPTALPLPNRPNVIAIRGRGGLDPLIVGKIEGGTVTWITSPPSGAWDQITAATMLGDDLWVTSGYSPHQLWRCGIGADLAATCVAKGEFPHGNANGALFAVPANTCDHPEGALLDLDTPPDGPGSGEPHDAHLYDIATGVWSTVKRPTGERRDLPRVVVLRDGRAMFVGGDGGTNPIASTEIFDGKTISAGPKLGNPRFGQGQALLPDGRILVTGGYAEDQRLPSWEILDVATGIATPSPQPVGDVLGRSFAAATGLFGACGYVSLGGRTADASAPIDYFAIASPGFQRLATPLLPAPVEYPASVTLPDGSLVSFGGRLPALDGGNAGEWIGDVYRLSPTP